MDRHYWTIWLALTAITFSLREFPALATGHVERTLSWYVWTHLKVITGQPIREWSAGHFIVAGFFAVFATWLGVHLFFRRLR